MAGNPYSNLANLMRSQGKKENGFSMKVAVVTGVKPLCILYDNVSISNNIHCNSVCTLEDKLEEILEGENLSDRLKGSLKSLFKGFQLETGDKVLVQRVGNDFFILNKMGGKS